MRWLKSLFLILQVFAASAQQANVWYFASGIGLDFNDSVPRILRDGKIINTGADQEASASICDNEGNLLFYTDGVTVWTREHLVMVNGTDLWGSGTTTQTLIVPNPSANGLYYIFTLSPQGETDYVPAARRGLHYSTIDMNRQGGSGELIEKNTFLSSSTSEKIAGVIHANKRDVWIVTHHWNKNLFRSFLITDRGVESKSVDSSVGITFDEASSKYGTYSIGQLKISPNGAFVAMALTGYPAPRLIEAFSFNSSTGKVEAEHFSFDFSKMGTTPYGIEFSPNNRFLYATDGYKLLYQFDLAEPTRSPAVLDPSPTSNFQLDTYGLQLAPNGRIYIARPFTEYLGVINNPNESSSACGYDPWGVYLSTNEKVFNCDGMLPNFVASDFFTDEFPRIAYVDVPNIFTPNGDGFNDSFEPIFSYSIRSSELSIFNRWGMQVTKIKSEAGSENLFKWSGDENPGGVYFWYLNYEGLDGREYIKKGIIELIRP